MSNSLSDEGWTKWVFAGGWTLLTLAIDGFVLWELSQEVRSYRYPAADGVVTHSRVRDEFERRRRLGPIDPNRPPDLEYRYSVGGQEFTGTRYSALSGDAGERTWRDAQAGLPVGTPVTVYYRPSDPALTRGLTGHSLFMLWFVLPFNLLMVAIWLRCSRRPKFDAADPGRVVGVPTGWQVGLPSLTRWASAALALGVVSFLGIFAIGIPTEFNPSVGLIAGAFGAAALVAAAVAFFARNLVLDIDESARTVPLPNGIAVPFAAVGRVEVAEVEWPTRKGTPARNAYSVNLHRADVAGPAQITLFADRADADRLAEWLRERLGLKPVD